MPDDTLAKAAYRAWKAHVVPPHEVDRVVNDRWSEMTPTEKELWHAIARAVLEAEEAASGDHRPSQCTAYHADDPRLVHDPTALRITVDINGVTATSTLRPSSRRATAEDLERAVVAVARMAAQMIAREMGCECRD